MIKVRFIDVDGTEQAVEGEPGMSVMEVAKDNGIEGVEADCGGACACATCHVYVDAGWAEIVGPAVGDEADMLEFAVDPEPNSRLSCQIRLTAALDGLTVRIPYSQH
jgi:ferredoxin, 2Fe-2S